MCECECECVCVCVCVCVKCVLVHHLGIISPVDKDGRPPTQIENIVVMISVSTFGDPVISTHSCMAHIHVHVNTVETPSQNLVLR